MPASGTQRILLLGASGQLGSDLGRRLAGAQLVALAHRNLDVTDMSAVERTVADVRARAAHPPGPPP